MCLNSKFVEVDIVFYEIGYILLEIYGKNSQLPYYISLNNRKINHSD